MTTYIGELNRHPLSYPIGDMTIVKGAEQLTTPVFDNQYAHDQTIDA